MGDLKKVGSVLGGLGGFAVGGPAGAQIGSAALGGRSVPKAVGNIKGQLFGQTKQLDSTAQDIGPLRSEIAQQLISAIQGGTLGQGFQGVLGQGVPPAQDTSFFYQNILGPYSQMFNTQRQGALAQAKESAGNLSGSGYNNILGSATAESLAQEQALSANVLMGLRQQELDRQMNFLRLLFGFGTAGVGQSQPYYQPGLFDAAAPILGSLIGRGAARG